MDLSLKVGDTRPWTIDCSTTDGYTFTIPDFTGAQATFSMKDASGTVIINDAPAVIVAPTVTAAVLSYSPVAGDVDTAGKYKAEFHVTYADLTRGSFPNGPPDDPYLNITIIQDI